MTDTAITSQRRRARLVLILIAGIPLSMMLGATALWWAVEQGHVDVLGSVGTANHGELIDPPRSVSDVVFQHEGVAETLWQDLPAKWQLLVVQRGGVCDAIITPSRCEDSCALGKRRAERLQHWRCNPRGGWHRYHHTSAKRGKGISRPATDRTSGSQIFRSHHAADFLDWQR